MSAVATLAGRVEKAARRTAPASYASLQASAPVPEALALDSRMLAELATALHSAANSDCPHLYSGESERLLGVAHNLTVSLLERNALNPAVDVSDQAFTVAALVKAALKVPGDFSSPERLASIELVKAPLIELTGCTTVMDGWETYPPVHPSERAAAPSDTPSADQASKLPSEVHDSLSIRLDCAEAVIQTLMHVFGGDAGIDEPEKCPGLHGTLKHAQWLLSGLHLEIMKLEQKLPDDLRSRIFEASELIDLLEHLEFARGFQFNKWSEDRMCMYFFAALRCVRAAQAALATVKVI